MQEARDQGQTVFLSSHILSQVEALCDRIGILRNGRLVEIGSLDAMRHLSALTVDAVFTATAPDLSTVPGVRHASVTGRRVHLQVQAQSNRSSKRWLTPACSELVSREPSLEELFLAHYGSDQDTAGDN